MATAQTIVLTGATDAATMLTAATLNGTALGLLNATWDTDKKVLTIPNYGTLTTETAGNYTALTLTLSATAPEGSYAITGAAGTVITTIDASAMTNPFTLGDLTTNALVTLKTGSGADTINATSTTLTTISTNAGEDNVTLGAAAAYAVNLGAGDDLVDVSAAVAASSKVTLGTGADTLKVEAAANIANLTVTDYNYAENDVVWDVASAGVVLSSTGKLQVNSNGTITTAVDSNVYKAKATTNGTSFTEYWTAKANTASATMDLSSVTNAAVIDASGTAEATINVSAKVADDLTLSAGKNTIVVGKDSGTKTFQTTIDTDDVLLVTNGKASDLSFTKTTITAGNTALNGAITEAVGKVKVSFDNGVSTKVVAYDSNQTTAGTLTQATDVNYYVGTNKSGIFTTLDSTTDVSLWDTDTYTNISKVSVTAGGTIVGNKSKATTIDAQSATEATSIWGGSTEADTIILGNTKAVDTVWFGSLDGKGIDSVAAFDNGFGTANDVLKLYDTTSLSAITVADATTAEKAQGYDVDLTIGTSTVAVDAANKATSDAIEIMLADGTTKKVAVDLNQDGNINGVGADVVIGDKDSANTNIVSYGAKQTDSLVVSLWSTDTYMNIKDVSLTGSTGAATVIGAKDKKSAITTGSGNAVVWAASTDTNSITLGSGTDVVWYGGATTDTSLNDGDDTVTGFSTAVDTVKLWDAKSAADIASSYTFTAAANTIIKSSSNKITTGLTLNSVDTSAANSATIQLQDANNDAIKAVVGGATSTLTFATDAQLYEGSAVTVKAGSGVTGSVGVFLGNSSTTSAGNYYFSSTVTTFDASASSASYTLIGRTDGTTSTLIGGKTSNAFWGGSYASQDIQGSTSAVDTVWFGSTDGQDTFSKGADKGDTIYLWNVTSIDTVSALNVGTNTETLVVGGSQLTITDTSNAALTGGLTFQLQDGTKYVYDSTSTNTNHLVKKA